MKVTISIMVEKSDMYWDKDKVEKSVSVESDTQQTLIAATVGAVENMRDLIVDAIFEKQARINLDEQEASDG